MVITLCLLPHIWANRANYGEQDEPIHSDEDEQEGTMGAFQSSGLSKRRSSPKSG